MGNKGSAFLRQNNTDKLNIPTLTVEKIPFQVTDVAVALGDLAESGSSGEMVGLNRLRELFQQPFAAPQGDVPLGRAGAPCPAWLSFPSQAQ